MNFFYYWLNLKKDVEEFVARCFYCQRVKEVCKHLGGMLQLILILEWKWEVIYMDFIIGLPRTSKQHDSMMVFFYRLSKVDHFILVRITYSTSEIA